MTPGEIAKRDQLYAAGLDQNRQTCSQRGHWFWGDGAKCLRCGDTRSDASPAPQWYQELFGVDS